MRRAVLAIACLAAPARADDGKPHAIYAELFGKGGLWGLGYEHALSPRLALGGVASYYVLGGDHYATFSPYLAAYPIAGVHHRWFVHAGPQVVYRKTPSPVPEWDGMSETGFSGELSTGYEYRNHVLVRVYAMAAAGDRFVPWLGASFGWTL